MSLSSLSIQRPVLATVMSIAIIIFGIIGYTFLGVREYPSVDQPIVTVSTNYPGANAEIIVSQITEPIEDAVNGIDGIRTITSTSRDGRSTVTVEFVLEKDLEAAVNDVRDKVGQAVGRLPADADPPIVSKADADASPIMFINFRSAERNMLELTDIAERVFKERLQTIPGVSSIQVWGAKTYAMRLWLDPDRLTAYRLTPLDVRNALLRENIELPSGSIEGENVELSVRTQGRLQTPDDFNSLIIKESGDQIVRFRDVGYAELGPENLRTVLRRDGIPMVGNAIVPQPGSNHIDIADEVYKRLDQMKKDLPADIEIGIGFDNTEYIRDSIEEVRQTIVVALVLVVLVIFLFLRDWRTTIIPVAVIPISLIGAFFIMYIMGFSINVLTLLGIVLAIGLVVDDAIVVMENIYAKIEQRMQPKAAAERGTAEIFFAVIATTVALTAVFLPVIFLQGLTGRLFREFGIVLAGAVIISSFVALTLTPMLASKVLKYRESHNWLYNVTEPFFTALNNGYRRWLNAFLRMREVAIGIIVLAVLGIIFIARELPSELAPLEDRGGARAIASAPEGVTFAFMDRYMLELGQKVQEQIPELKGVISVTSPGFAAGSSVNSGFLRVILVDKNQRVRTQQEIANQLQGITSQLPGARAFITQEVTIGNRRGGLPVQYVIQATSMDKLKSILPTFIGKAMEQPEFSFVDVDLKFNKPELAVEIDRDKARTMGVSVLDIAQTMQLALSGQRFGYFIMNGKQYQVLGQVAQDNRNEPVDLKGLYVRNNAGDMIQLDNLLRVEEQTSSPQYFRFNRYVSATVSAQLAEGVSLGDGIVAMEKVGDEVLDDTFTHSWNGSSRDFLESSSSLVFALLLALVLIYLVLSAQFESFRDPIIIMFTVPLAITGAVLSLSFFGQSLNIFSQIGIIMLIGLVTKNGILIVEFANQRKAAGLSVQEAIREASVARFRPILMTSLSTILGTLPIALALGAGAESRVSMGIAVIGGLVFSTVLTLFVIPAMYTYISEKTKSVSNLDAAETTAS